MVYHIYHRYQSLVCYGMVWFVPFQYVVYPVVGSYNFGELIHSGIRVGVYQNLVTTQDTKFFNWILGERVGVETF